MGLGGQKTNVIKQKWEGVVPAHKSIVDMNLNLFCRKKLKKGQIYELQVMVFGEIGIEDFLIFTSFRLKRKF